MKIGWVVLLACGSGFGQAGLQREIRAIGAEAKGRVEVACALPGSALNCDVEAHARPPMQSVFKLPLAMAMLHEVDLGRFKLDQPVRFMAADVTPGLYSPLQDKYPKGEVDVPLRELLRLAVSQSDNVAAEILLRVLGGTGVVDEYMRAIGVLGFQLLDGERATQADVRVQYRNWWEPAGAVTLLRMLADKSPVSVESTKVLLGWMRETETGVHRLKAGLPAGTVLMHKTGTSGVSGGVAGATNDIGLIVLPDGRMLALAVFVTDSRAEEKVREAVIARIAEAVYRAAVAAR